MRLNIPKVTPIPMKKIPALAGLAAGMIVQLVTEVGSVIGVLSALMLSVASAASFVMKSGTSEASCPSCETRIQVSMKGGEKNGE